MSADCATLTSPFACSYDCGWLASVFDDSQDQAVSVLQVKTNLLPMRPAPSLADTITMQPVAMDSIITPVTVTMIASLTLFALLVVAQRVNSKNQFSLKANKWVCRGDACVDSHGDAKGKQCSGYTMFREMLKHPSASMVKSRLLDFIKRFPAGLESHGAARQVHRFVDSIQVWMLSEGSIIVDVDEQGVNNLKEGLEKYVIHRLHPKICLKDGEQSVEDKQMQKHISGLSWVTFKNLGIPPIKPELLSLAIREMQRIDEYKAPRDKLVCILNACRVIDEVFKLTMAEEVDTGAGGPVRQLSADDFLPILIYTVIKANPQRLPSNLAFVETFRHPGLFVAEDAYFFTALQSAVFFVKEIGYQKLDVTSEEFDALYAEALAASEQADENGCDRSAPGA